MNFTIETYEETLEKLLVQAAAERDPAKRKYLRRQISQMKSAEIKPLKLAPPPRKSWWPASCRGIVG